MWNDNLFIDNDLDFEEDEDLAGVGKMNRREYLEKLKKNDPEFYATMMASSDIMDMNSSGEEEEEDDDEEEDDQERGGPLFEPPSHLEVCNCVNNSSLLTVL